jgi:hypothetical protein
VPLRRPSEIRCATSIARSKIATRPASSARARAPARTFSSRRGTTTRKVGRTIPSSSARSIEIRGDGDLDALIDRGVHLYPTEGVRQREERERPRLRWEQLRYLLDRLADVGREVGVGQLAALRLACGARRVQHRGEVLTPQRVDPRIDLVGVSEAAGFEPVQRPLLDHEHMLETAIRIRRPRHQFALLGGLDNGHASTAVGQDRRDLRRRGGVVDGHRDRAGREDRVIDEHPLAAGAGQQQDPVTRVDAEADQPGGEGTHGRPHLGGGERTEAVAVARGQQRTVGVAVGPPPERGEQVRLWGRLQGRAGSRWTATVAGARMR